MNNLLIIMCAITIICLLIAVVILIIKNSELKYDIKSMIEDSCSMDLINGNKEESTTMGSTRKDSMKVKYSEDD